MCHLFVQRFIKTNLKYRLLNVGLVTSQIQINFKMKREDPPFMIT